ncbi:MAG: AAA family ATPase [Chloroflexia bacterium]|nr:AAA family ATPase [Chloroflexia bacterium]
MDQTMIASSLSSGSSLPFVGRSREIDHLARCVDQARAGQGATVIVSGEAGIGKSSLVSQISAGTLVLTGHCYDFAAAPPYGPWIEILEDGRLARSHMTSQLLFDEHGAGGSAQDQRELFSAIFRLIADIAEAHPVTLIFEDLQGRWPHARRRDWLASREVWLGYQQPDLGRPRDRRRRLPDGQRRRTQRSVLGVARRRGKFRCCDVIRISPSPSGPGACRHACLAD